MSTESTSTPTTTTPKKKDKLFGFDVEDIALYLGGAAAIGVAALGFMKLQELNIIPKPPMGQATGPPSERVTYGPPPVTTPPVVNQPPNGGMVDRDPLGGNINSVAMDHELANPEYVDQERIRRSREYDRINAGV